VLNQVESTEYSRATTLVHTRVLYNTAYGWNRPILKAQCSLFTYSGALIGHM